MEDPIAGIAGLEYIRDRLRDLINGETTVDVGTLLYGLNNNIGRLGGKKVDLTRDEIRSRFYTEIDPIE